MSGVGYEKGIKLKNKFPKAKERLRYKLPPVCIKSTITSILFNPLVESSLIARSMVMPSIL